MGLRNLLVHGFIGHNFRLMLLLLENRILHGVSFVEDGDFTLCISAYRHSCLAYVIRRPGGLNLINNLFILQGEVFE